MFVRLWRERNSASRWVSSILCCASVMVNWILNDQFGSEEPVINALMVEIPMFSLCDVGVLKLSLTVRLSGPQLSAPREKQPHQCASVCLCVRGYGRSWHTSWRFQIFMVRTCCEKGARQNTFMYTCVPERVRQGQIYITGCCIFLLNTFPARSCLNCFCILPLNRSEREKKHTADYCQVCALIFIWSYTPQSNYKISLINTALVHKHDTEDPSSHSPFLK